MYVHIFLLPFGTFMMCQLYTFLLYFNFSYTSLAHIQGLEFVFATKKSTELNKNGISDRILL